MALSPAQEEGQTTYLPSAALPTVLAPIGPRPDEPTADEEPPAAFSFLKDDDDDTPVSEWGAAKSTGQPVLPVATTTAKQKHGITRAEI